MLTRAEILTKLKSIMPVLEKKYNVRTLALFGSYSRNDALPESDVDLMVDFTQNPGIAFIDLADELEMLLHNKVDLVTRNAIKPKYLNVIKQDLIYV